MKKPAEMNESVGMAVPKRHGEVERRIAQRYQMSASADVSEVTTGARLQGRIADISITGCYLDSINCFAPGTRVALRIQRAEADFICECTVQYAKSGMGMGLAFLLDDAQKAALEAWIEQLDPSARLAADPVFQCPSAKSDLASQPDSQSPSQSPTQLKIPISQNHPMIVLRLIESLRKKKVLTEAEVAEVLADDIP